MLINFLMIRDINLNISFENMKEKVVRTGVSLPPKLLEAFDELIKEKRYANRSEAIRDLIRDFIVDEEWKTGNKEVAGTLTIVYEHSKVKLIENLLDIQHHYKDLVISSMHVHLNDENCLEVIVLRGNPDEIKKVADRIVGEKGVKHGKLVMTTTGKELS